MNTPPRGWRPRFSLTSLMLVSLVCCMTAAAARYLVQGLAAGASGRAYFVISVLVLPMLLLIGANLMRLAVGRRQARQRRRR